MSHEEAEVAMKRRLGGALRDSAVARLLVEGKLPEEESRVSPTLITSDIPPMDLSSRGNLRDVQGSPRHLEQLHQTISSEMRTLMLLPYTAGMEWKCLFCPYMAKDRSKLYSHYQFHLQLLASSSPASESHLEWLAAYRSSRSCTQSSVSLSEERRSASPSSDLTSDADIEMDSPRMNAWPHLRNLLASHHSKMADPNASASGFLRSIVQTIMQKSPSQTPTPGNSESTSDDHHDTCREIPNSSSSISPGTTVKRETPDEIFCDVNSQNTAQREETCSSPKEPALDSQSYRGNRKRKPGATLDEVVRCLTNSNSVNSTPQPAPQSEKSSAKCEISNFIDSDQVVKRRRTESSSSSDVSSGGFLREHEASPAASPGLDQFHRNARDTAFSPGAEPCTKGTYCSRGVQCNLLFAPLLQCSSERFARNPSERVPCPEATRSSSRGTLCRVSEAQEGHFRVMTTCHHCGITFDDEVLHSIHMGCHSHKDPFICNVCGKYCSNKYGFYSHIMRGHKCDT